MSLLTKNTRIGVHAVVMMYFLFVLVGVFAGFSSGLLGISGGLITIPALIFIFEQYYFPEYLISHMAIGTSLSAMILSSLGSTYVYHQRSLIDWKVFRHLLPGLVIACLLGSWLGVLINGPALERIFGGFLLLVGSDFIFRPVPRVWERVKRQFSTFLWMGFVIGGISSLLGIGGGIITVPLLLGIQLPMLTAIGTSTACGAMLCFLAAIIYAILGPHVETFTWTWGYIYLPGFFIIGISAFIAAPLGYHYAKRTSQKNLRRIFGAALFFLGIWLMWN